MTVWAQLRAGLIALVIAVGLLDGCPVPRTGNERKHMQAQLGPDLSAAVLELDRARLWLLRPFRPIDEHARLNQRWKLFAGAPRKRFRVWIEARSAPDGAWEVLYRAGDDDTPLGDRLAYRRMRAAYNPHSLEGPRGTYTSFATWVSRVIFAREPRFTEVRVRQERIRIGDGGGWVSSGEFLYEQRRHREAGR